MSFKHVIGTMAPTSTPVASEVSIHSGKTTAVYACPQDGCVRAFIDPLLWRATCMWKSVHSH